jgi:hypothetical protein
VIFKITNRSKIYKSHLKFNNNFKNHITFEMILRNILTLLGLDGQAALNPSNKGVASSGFTGCRSRRKTQREKSFSAMRGRERRVEVCEAQEIQGGK